MKLAGTAGAGLTFDGLKLNDSTEHAPNHEFVGVLTDTTRCIGCRSCEKACAEAHGFEVPDVENDNALASPRTTTERSWTVVNRYETEKGTVFVKKQCMHCWQPACASACLTNAMYKTTDGPVIWRSSKCMGCRFCMVACPFEIPKFEYNSWNPKIQKCNMCWERLEKGMKPACVQACPTDALMFGLKREIMEIARVRIYHHPDKYVHRIYGEQEVGGTGWLYLAAVPFEQLGFRTDLGTTPYPDYTREFLYGVPVVLFGLPALLLGLKYLAERNGNTEELEDKHA
jgi:Fe-S-cluster-containing dehydrogenase component